MVTKMLYTFKGRGKIYTQNTFWYRNDMPRIYTDLQNRHFLYFNLSLSISIALKQIWTFLVWDTQKYRPGWKQIYPSYPILKTVNICFVSNPLLEGFHHELYFCVIFQTKIKFGCNLIFFPAIEIVLPNIDTVM